MTGHCRHHSFETAASVCNRCGAEYCSHCLVHPFGKSKPLCKDCAMTVSGVKMHAATLAMSRRMVRARTKAFGRRSIQPTRELPPVQAPVPVPVMAYAAVAADPGAGVAPPIDWSRPFG